MSGPLPCVRITLGSAMPWEVSEINYAENADGQLEPFETGKKIPGHMVDMPGRDTRFVPAERFAEVYQASGQMDFAAALTCMKAGMRVARKSWGGAGYLTISDGDILGHRNGDDAGERWHPSQPSLSIMATDWEVV